MTQPVHTQDNSVQSLQHQIDHLVEAITPRLIALRRDLHAHPELAFQETRTARIVAHALERLGLPYRTGIAKTGLIADIAGNKPGLTLLLRADMDALPIQEATNLPYASQVPGCMHACGHDLHTVTLIGVAAVLATLQPQRRGNIRLMFQPAEETLSGARAMIAEGVLDGVDAALGFHNRPDLPAGRFGLVHGASTARCDNFTIRLHGLGGHGAKPHLSRSPIVAGALLTTQLQALVSQEINPLHACAIGIGAFQAGETHNVIPSDGLILGTIRTREEAACNAARAALIRLCAGIQEATGVLCEPVFEDGAPASINDERLLRVVRNSLLSHFGPVADDIAPSMGSEDFAYIAQRVPAFRLHIGSGSPGRNDRVHTATYQPDEACLNTGTRALARIALDILEQS